MAIVPNNVSLKYSSMLTLFYFYSRASAAACLGDCTFLVSPPEDYDTILSSLEKIFTEKTGANAPEDMYALQTAALSAWTLLYSLLPSSQAFNSLESHMDLFEQLLDSSNVDLRIGKTAKC